MHTGITRTLLNRKRQSALLLQVPPGAGDHTAARSQQGIVGAKAGRVGPFTRQVNDCVHIAAYTRTVERLTVYRTAKRGCATETLPPVAFFSHEYA